MSKHSEALRSTRCFGPEHWEHLYGLIKERDQLLEALQAVVALANQVYDHWDNDRDSKVGKHLLALSGHWPGYHKRTDSIHAAIAKATGQQPPTT